MNRLQRSLRLLPAVAGVALAAGLPARGEAPARIEFVDPQAVRAQAPHPQAGIFVLDLEGLESAEAAQDLVDTWRLRHPQAAAAACWLRGPHRQDLLVAAGLLTRGPQPTCHRVYLGMWRR